MKFLCDVHISFKLVNAIKDLGFSCVHVNSILDSWFTKDSEISKFVDSHDYIMVTKDADFRNSFFINQTPKKLIKINLGNISNLQLTDVFVNNVKHFEKINNENKKFIIEIDIDKISFSTLD
jgi:predicted nuclease of predicted toxin-antitoxin system